MKTLNTILVIILLILASAKTLSQVNTEWSRIYTGITSGNDLAKKVKADVSGNVFVAGHSFHASTSADLNVIKYNSAGALLWEKTILEPGMDLMQDMTIDNSSNVYITCMSLSVTTGWDITIAKYDTNGNLMFFIRMDYTGAGVHDYPNSIVVDADQNIFVAGYTQDTISDADMLTMKFYANGSLSWMHYYDGDNGLNDHAIDMEIDLSQSIFITGTSETSTGVRDVVTIKYYNGGAFAWIKKFSSINGSDEYPKAITCYGGDVYITGGTKGTGNNYFDVFTARYSSSNGQQVWLKTFNWISNGDDEGRDIYADNNYNVYVTGKGNGANNTADCITIKYDYYGNQVYGVGFCCGINLNDEANDIEVDALGNAFICGYVSNANGRNFLLVKYSPNGTQQWYSEFNGSADKMDEAYSLCLKNNKIIVTGTTQNQNLGFDIITMQISEGITGVSGNENGIPSEFSLSQNYPNPFNPSTKIAFSIPKASFVKMAVYDITGREIEMLVNEQMNAGTFEVDFNASKLTSGVYFCKITTDGFTDVKKMILAK